LEDDHFNVSGTAKQPKNWFIEGPENSFIQTDSEFIEYSEIRSEFDLKKTNTTAKEPFDSIIPDFLDLSSSQKSEITPPALESLSSVLFDKTPQTSNQPSILDTFVDQDNSPDWLELSMLTSEARKAAIAALKADWLAEHERLLVVDPPKNQKITQVESLEQQQNHTPPQVENNPSKKKENDTIKESISEKMVDTWLQKRSDIEGFKTFFSLRIYGIFWFWKFLKDKHLWGLGSWGISSRSVWFLLPFIGLFGRPIFFEIIASNISSNNEELVLNLDMVRFVSRISTVMDVLFVVYTWDIFWRCVGKRVISHGEILSATLLFLGSILCFSFLISYFQGQYNYYLKTYWKN